MGVTNEHSAREELTGGGSRQEYHQGNRREDGLGNRGKHPGNTQERILEKTGKQTKKQTGNRPVLIKNSIFVWETLKHAFLLVLEP